MAPSFYGYEWAMESYTDDFVGDMPSNVEPNPNESTGGEDSDAMSQSPSALWRCFCRDSRG